MSLFAVGHADALSGDERAEYCSARKSNRLGEMQRNFMLCSSGVMTGDFPVQATTNDNINWQPQGDGAVAAPLDSDRAG